MSDFFAKLTKGEFGEKNKKVDKKKDVDDDKGWSGGRSGDMSTLNKGSDRSIGVGSGGAGDERAKASSSSSNIGGRKDSNPFAKVGANINEALGKIDFLGNNKKPSFKKAGSGQSLGGSQPGRVFSVSLNQPGPIGVEVERRKNSVGTAIVAAVVPSSQADAAGLQRGDIICHLGSNGEQEVHYDQFVAMAKSGRRPLVFDIRRIESPLARGARGVGGTSSSVGVVGSGSGKNKPSADAYARKQAVIAAAEAREAKRKIKSKPNPKSSDKKPDILSTAEFRRRERLRAEALRREAAEGTMGKTEETRRVVDAVKRGEQEDAAHLGFNMYESRAATGGQGRNASVAAARGELNVGNAPNKLVGAETAAGNDASCGGGGSGSVRAPADPTSTTEGGGVPPSPAFEEAFAAVATGNLDDAVVLKAIGIMRKLIVNATTKGQQGGDEEASSKFRRVRLSNPKIRQAITDVNGALELMLSVGFVLSENHEDGETYLVFSLFDVGPEWLSSALQRMSTYENGGS